MIKRKMKCAWFKPHKWEDVYTQTLYQFLGEECVREWREFRFCTRCNSVQRPVIGVFESLTNNEADIVHRKIKLVGNKYYINEIGSTEGLGDE